MMRVPFNDKEKKIKNEVSEWIEIDKNGYPQLKVDAPEDIKNKYKYLKNRMKHIE